MDIKSLTITMLMAFVIVVIIGPIFLPMLHRLKFGQTVRDDGPQTHLAKNGTPTMGGIMFMIAITITVLFRAELDSDVFVGLVCMLGFGLVGFLDDFIIIKMRRSLGLKPWQKIAMQFVISGYVAFYQYTSSPAASKIMIPFTDKFLDLGILYVPVMMFIIIGTVNAVNLTDGLDGLASGITAVVSTFFVVFALFVAKDAGVATFAAATVGGCVGFLVFNVNPAKVFMGDTGSMALGGAVVAFAVLTNSVLLIPIVGGIYFAEALSVIIQVTYFKKTGKRIFKMAPLHHHFEQCGWPETKVVFIFWIVTIILAWIGVVAGF